MKIYQHNIFSDVINFAINEVHCKCDICNIIPNKNQLKKKKDLLLSLWRVILRKGLHVHRTKVYIDTLTYTTDVLLF